MTPFRIELTPSRRWRAAVALVAAASVSSVLAWWALVPTASGIAVGVVATVVIVAAVGSAASLCRLGGGVLSFDGRAWWWTRRPGDEPIAGAARVAIDLGDFFLFRFQPALPRGHVWLPVDSAVARGDWHVLRAAVYSARLGRESSAAGAPSPE